MFKTDKLYIWPCDGIESGEEKLREIPLVGYFAVKFGKGRLERALHVNSVRQQSDLPHWTANLDGFLLAPPSPFWREAFGKIWADAQKRAAAPILLGRRINHQEYVRLVASRIADKERGVDLSAEVDLNSVEIPTF